MPRETVIRRAWRRLSKGLALVPDWTRDAFSVTYSTESHPLASGLMHLDSREWRMPKPMAEVCSHFLLHRFDVLGSGWVHVYPGMRAKGLEGYSYAPAKVAPRQVDRPRWTASGNRSVAQSVRGMISGEYEPIDWQLDVKSGYRWSANRWSRGIRIRRVLGADVKVPWELARGHHLVQLAMLACSSDTAPDVARRCVQETADTMLDFIAANPPGFGVNWMSAMDAAIRVTNWLVARDILVCGGHVLPKEFEQVLSRSVVDHARMIAEDLRQPKAYRHNHYLAGLVGLLFTAAYLPESAEASGWMDTAISELGTEVEHQFLGDGGNFEGSTAYHGLSTDMVVWSCILLHNLRIVRASSAQSSNAASPAGQVEPKTDRTEWDACIAAVEGVLSRAGEFARALTRPDGALVQIGDNDSGRLLKLASSLSAESSMDLSTVLHAADVVLASPAWTPITLDTAFGLTSEVAIAGVRPGYPSDPAGDRGAFDRVRANEVRSRRHVRRYSFEVRSDAGAVSVQRFPDFGVYVYRGEDVYAAIRCGAVGLEGHGGHSHCDQLALELWLNGSPVVCDPGSYVYTPLPARRNLYRSVRAHWAPQVEGREYAALENSLFALEGARDGVAVHVDARGFVGYHESFGFAVWRAVEFTETAITVEDGCDEEQLLDLCAWSPLPYSPGYGQLLAGSSPLSGAAE